MYSFQTDIYIGSIKELYKYFSQEEIFKFVFGEYPNYQTKYNSPFRKDDNPSCYFIKRGRMIYFVDWSMGTIDAIEAVKLLYGLDLGAAITLVRDNLKIGSASSLSKSYDDVPKVVKSETIILPQRREWETRDVIYWSKRYGISTADLDEDRVFPISLYSYRKNDVWKSISLLDIGYAISAHDKYKIYRPLANKKSKWLSNIPKNIVLGKHNFINEPIIITKSYKDFRVIYNLIGGNVIWLQSEGTVPDNLNTFLEPYGPVTVFYDNDQAGIFASNRLANLINKPVKQIYSEYAHLKDISEMYCFKGKSFTQQWLKDILNVGENSLRKS